MIEASSLAIHRLKDGFDVNHSNEVSAEWRTAS